MSNYSYPPWSDDPNAPQISSPVYIVEKYDFAGVLIGAIFYGVVIALFLQCMGVLLNPVKPIKKSVKWALVAHTMAMFSFFTISFGICLNDLSIAYVDNRDFQNEVFPPGPLGYGLLLDTAATTTVFYIMFPLNQWLADGLLLHRCYIIYYSTNYFVNFWVMAFPFLMYLASVAMGIAFIYQQLKVKYSLTDFGTAYFSVSLALNVILTLMIITRLVLHRRKLRKAIGASGGAKGLYTAIVTMLVESYAIYALAFLIYIISWAVGSPIVAIPSKALGAIQAIAPYLIVLRVTNRRALTSDTISGAVESMRFRSQETTDDDGSLPGEDHISSMEVNGDAPGELGAGAEEPIKEVSL